MSRELVSLSHSFDDTAPPTNEHVALPDDIALQLEDPRSLLPEGRSSTNQQSMTFPTAPPPPGPPQTRLTEALAGAPPPPTRVTEATEPAPPPPPTRVMVETEPEAISTYLPPALPLPMSLVKLDGPSGAFSRLQATLQKIERGELALPTAAELHSSPEFVDARTLQQHIREYLGGGESSETLAALDARLLACHGVLLEDLPLEVLDSFCKDKSTLEVAEALGDELGHTGSAEQRQVRGIEDVRQRIYGNCRFPIPTAQGTGSTFGLPITETRRQLVIERTTQNFALREYLDTHQRQLDEGRGSSSGSKMKVWTPWVEAISGVLNKRSEGPARGKGSLQLRLLQNLGLQPEVLAVIACQTTLNLIFLPSFRRKDDMKEAANSPAAGQVPYVTAVIALGEAVELEKWFMEMSTQSRLRSGASQDRADLMAKLLRRQRASQAWSEATQTVPVGAALLDLLLDCAYVPADWNSLTLEEREHAIELPHRNNFGDNGAVSDGSPENRKVMIKAFEHGLRRDGLKTVGYVALNPSARSQLSMDEADMMSFIQPKFQPMVMKPLPWQPCGQTPRGGYLLHKLDFVRTTNQSLTNLKAYSARRVSGVMNFIGSLPWQVDREMLDLMKEVKRLDLGIAEVPKKDNPIVPELPAPEELESLSAEARADLLLRRHNAQKRCRELQSERPTFELKLKVAEDFLEAPRLFFPHNVDFRGRAYPVPPHLNHMGDDVCRGLLKFAEAKPLGESGLYWLQVNLANLFGHNKISFDERVAWVQAHKNSILKAAEDPLSPESIEFWSNAGDGPWQALARCKELAQVWKSDDPKNFLSQWPIHLDGSCNGLQHYAALGRDELGGLAVNLVPSDRPQDVYTVVLGIVQDKVAKDAERPPVELDEDLTDEQKAALRVSDPGHLARRLIELDVLKRKVVKQTVMTICYGVTSLGAMKQVQGQLEDMVGEHVDPAEIKKLAVFLSKLVMRSIDEVFERAMKIKNWFDRVSKEFNEMEVPNSWLSPIGLACVQPYKKPRKVNISTKRQRVTLRDGDAPAMDKSKQRMGFPPNFIHSLDATHMMMVAEGCEKRGISFAAVHDSFWTHAGDAPILNEVIREAFIELHGQPLLDDLVADIQIHLGGIKLPPLPPRGSLDLSVVRDSPYIFN